MPERELTTLIAAASRGEAGAQERLWQVVYPQVREQARRTAAKRRSSIQPTELVSQLYLKMGSERKFPCADRRYFFAMVAHAIRQILADHAKARRRRDRVLGVVFAAAAGQMDTEVPTDPQVLIDALAKLDADDPRCAEVVRLRGLVGLGTNDVAEILEMKVRTVEREWQFGRRWIARYLAKESTV